MPSAAAVATMPAAVTTAAPSTAPTTPTTTTTTAARTSSPATAISAISTIPSVRRTISGADMRSAFAIEVRLLRIIRKIAAAFDHQRATLHRLALGDWRHCSRFPAARRRHLRALLFQNRFTREPNAVAFHRQNLHQHPDAL